MATTKDRIAYQVYTTTDYEQFKHLNGNRDIVPIHLKRLKKSIEEQYLVSILLVNEKMQVIDGQHRLEICKSLGLPVFYLILSGYGLSENQRYNSNFKKYSPADYLAGGIDLGLPDYIQYKEFQETFGFTHEINLMLLAGGDRQIASHDFATSHFKVKNYKKACEVAENLNRFQPYFPQYKATKFATAVLSIMKSPKLNYDELIRRAKKYPAMLKQAATTEQYKEMLEALYNYHRTNKVSLKYHE